MTKRQIGLLFSLAGIGGVITILIYDLIRQKSITSVQVVALAGCIGVFVMGAALIPLGDRPA